MNAKQNTRFEKLNYESFYLLNMKKEPDKFVLDISGSTRNIYQIKVYDNKITCNCPDQKSWAKHYKCVCKHCCFVIFKVCDNVISTESNFWNTLKFNETEFELINDILLSKFVMFNTHEDETIDKDLIKKFELLKIGKNIFSTEKKLSTDELCPICYDESETECLECPKCKKIFHKQCMEKWLDVNKSCVYCRSDIWESYCNDMCGEYKNLGY